MRFEHLSADPENTVFDVERFVAVKNGYNSKPLWGTCLWAGPIGEPGPTWRNFAASAFERWRMMASFEFELDSRTRMLELLGKKACAQLPFYLEANRHGDEKYKVVDWEGVAKEHDAAYVAGKALAAEDMWGWDVPTLLVLNPEVVQQVF